MSRRTGSTSQIPPILTSHTCGASTGDASVSGERAVPYVASTKPLILWSRKWLCDLIRGPHPLATVIINLKYGLVPEADPIRDLVRIFQSRAEEKLEGREYGPTETMSLPWWRDVLRE